MISAQQWFERPPDFGPKLNLPGDGPFHRLACHPGIQQQGIRNFDWLTHVPMVANCYHRVKPRMGHYRLRALQALQPLAAEPAS